jgi:pantoate kinase
MNAIAFAPGHITGFFEPVFSEDFNRTGSRGAGVNITLGAISEVIVEPSNSQNIMIFLNGKKSSAPVTTLAVKHLIGNNTLRIIIKTKLELPLGQGFGMSGAGALSACLSLVELIENISTEDAIRAAHFAEVQSRKGLGDVIASCFGGIEIRKEPGLPPWGVIEHIPGQFEIVLCVIGKKIDTKKVLINQSLVNQISEYGRLYTKKILEKPSIENFFKLSKEFTFKTNIADENIKNAIVEIENYGLASMCMLGNSIFAVGKTQDLCRILSKHGEIYLCFVDEGGARVLEE